MDKETTIAKILNRYLHNSVQMEAHGQFGDVAHEVVQPVVQTSQYCDGSPHVSVFDNIMNNSTVLLWWENLLISAEKELLVLLHKWYITKFYRQIQICG